MGSGRKASKSEKDQIRTLIHEGAQVADLMRRYPDIDGRSLSGMYRKAVQLDPALEQNPGGNFPPPIAGAADAPPSMPADPPRPSPGGGAPPPPPGGGGSPPPPARAAWGPTSDPALPNVRDSGRLGTGFQPSHQEYFLVRKMNGPDAGLKDKEYPPFQLPDLLKKYPPGEYEIYHYVNNRLWQTYRDTVAGPAGPAITGQPARQPAETSGMNLMIQALDVADRLQEKGRREAEGLSVAKLNLEATRENAKATAEATRDSSKIQAEAQTTGSLIGMVQSILNRPQPENSAEKGLHSLLATMQEQNKHAEARHEREMERIREQAKLDLQLAEKKLEAEERRLKADLDSREKMQTTFMTKIQELDGDRQKLWKEAYDNMSASAAQTQEMMQKDFEDRKQHLTEMEKMGREHLKELAEIRKTSGTGDKDIEVAKIIQQGIVGGLDRIGARIDSLADKGIIKGGATRPLPPPAAPGAAPAPNGAPPAPAGGGAAAETHHTEEAPVSMKKLVEESLNSPWFQDLKEEIVLTMKKRQKVDAMPDLDPKQKKMAKPHGSVLAQGFIDRMNEDVAVRRFCPYIIAREWPTVLKDLDPKLTEEERALLTQQDAELWWFEFQIFVTQAWNTSLGITT